jgi:hypothetical protein
MRESRNRLSAGHLKVLRDAGKKPELRARVRSKVAMVFNLCACWILVVCFQRLFPQQTSEKKIRPPATSMASWLQATLALCLAQSILGFHVGSPLHSVSRFYAPSRPTASRSVTCATTLRQRKGGFSPIRTTCLAVSLRHSYAASHEQDDFPAEGTL